MSTMSCLRNPDHDSSEANPIFKNPAVTKSDFKVGGQKKMQLVVWTVNDDRALGVCQRHRQVKPAVETFEYVAVPGYCGNTIVDIVRLQTIGTDS